MQGCISMNNRTREMMETAIANNFNYQDIHSVKEILNKYNLLIELIPWGYEEAHNIVMDIDNAIAKCSLTPIERTCLIGIEINHNTLKIIADELERSTFYVFTNNSRALEKLYLYLNGGISDGQ